MDLFQSLVLGVIQGITEWLPISSQGQVMVLAMRVFGLTVQESVSHSLFLHVGTLAA
ncbi:MAG TPA: undecaprenyl-diphosphate phosphatase, partial [Candidatus Diapherotrites archaeon]|nr:undecaprenyl-diphosphate phosphatase [Candidatus Diapherotrites archaeon]